MGAFNLSAPHPVSNAVFLRALAKELGRPYWLPAPAFALKLFLGEMSTLLLDGQYAFPAAAAGTWVLFFKYEHVEQAFQALYH